MELTAAPVIQVDFVVVSLKAQTRHVCHTREIGLQCDQKEIPLSLSLSLPFPARLLRQSISIGQQVCMANRSTQKCLLNFGAQSRLEGIIVWLTSMKPGHKAKLLSGFSASRKKTASVMQDGERGVLGGPSNPFYSHLEHTKPFD